MSLGLLMPGQGSQKLGMGLDFTRTGNSKEIFDKSQSYLDWDLIDLIKNGPLDKLSNTRYCQPAIYTTSCAISSHLKGNKDVKAVSGHSLGQFAAGFFCEAFSFEEGLQLVSRRAQIMDENSNGGDLGMAAVIGIAPEIVKEVVDQLEGIYCANFNSQQQTVISGPLEALDIAAEKFTARGARRFVKLSVSGAFHSPYMEEANKLFAKHVEEVPFKDPAIPMVSNITGELLTDKKSIKDEFLAQMTSNVDWIAVINKFAEQGVASLVEIGPGNILTGFSKRINNDISYINLDDVSVLKEFDREQA